MGELEPSASQLSVTDVRLLGCRHAQYSIGNFSAAVEAYTKGIQLDGNNANMKASLAQAQSKAKEQEKQLEREADEVDDDAVTSGAGADGSGAGGMPDLASLASMFGGAGAGAGGAGGAGKLCGPFHSHSKLTFMNLLQAVCLTWLR